MRRVIAAGFVALALIASACAGSSGASAGVVVSGEQGAAGLIAALGSDNAAADALIIAMDRGYSSSQILDAVDDGRLRSGGTIQGQEPAGQPLNLVQYQLDGEGEGALGPQDKATGQVMLTSFFQVQKTPIGRLRENASPGFGLGETATDLILLQLAAGFIPKDIIELLILGIDETVDHPSDLKEDVVCLRVVNELYCPDGERFPASVEPDSPPNVDEDTAASDTAAAEPVAESAPMQLLWEGEMTPNPDFVKDPIAGSYELSRTAGTDEFQIRLVTTDAKSGTATTDGFDQVECTSEWGSVFEGTGTFWDVNDLGIEFEGQITRSTVFTSGPCEAEPPDTSDFSGIVVFITDTGIESSFNAWSFAVAGPPPVPVS